MCSKFVDTRYRGFAGGRHAALDCLDELSACGSEYRACWRCLIDHHLRTSSSDSNDRVRPTPDVRASPQICSKAAFDGLRSRNNMYPRLGTTRRPSDADVVHLIPRLAD